MTNTCSMVVKGHVLVENTRKSHRFSPLLVDGGGFHSASPDDGLVKVREGSFFLSCHPLYPRVSLLP